jgi:hypothetical protein
MIVSPESVPTLSFQFSVSAKPLVASESVATIPRTNTPIPAAKITAAAAPVGGSSI